MDVVVVVSTEMYVPSVHWHCWLGIRKSLWPVKNWVMRCRHGYLFAVRCKWFGYGPADATAAHHLLHHYNPHWFSLSGAGLPRLSWRTKPLNGCLS